MHDHEAQLDGKMLLLPGFGEQSSKVRLLELKIERIQAFAACAPETAMSWTLRVRVFGTTFDPDDDLGCFADLNCISFEWNSYFCRAVFV